MDGPVNSNESHKAEEKPRTRLEDLVSQATLQYSSKHYDAAAELYAHATELQAELNGEMSTQNADLLYSYGRCLYHVAVRKSDVLGSNVAGEGPAPSKQENRRTTLHADQNTDSVGGLQPESRASSSKAPGEVSMPAKPYFEFKGDENFDASDDDDDTEEDENDSINGGEQEEEEEDDFANAFEVLDLARILILQKLREEDGASAADGTQADTLDNRALQERLADTFDLQAEISLEGERFGDAATDFRSSLEWKTKLYPPESSLLAEGHYKLSLALEFASSTYPRNKEGQLEEGQEPVIDYEKRKEAAREMETAIASCKQRIQVEEAKSRDAAGDGENESAEILAGEVKKVREMVGEMEQRLAELRQPPVSINNTQAMATLDAKPAASLLRSKLGQSEDAQKANLEDAIKNANDLTGFVKKQKTDRRLDSSSSYGDNLNTSGKRKADATGHDTSSRDKKAKLED